MGSGSWSSVSYHSSIAEAAATGRSTMDYSDITLASVPRSTWKPHELLDAHGLTIRESRDSDEHPNSLAIAVIFDVTGSMQGVPRELQKRLGELFSLLLIKGYVETPQVMFGAIGDATCDRVPLQIGQFESDNRIDEALSKIALEGGGGGQQTESYELAFYVMARHTDIDCWNKRSHRGYLFVIGDEMAYPQVKPREITAVLGEELAEPVSLEAILQECQERYEVYYIQPTGTSYTGTEEIAKFWRKLLGQNYIALDGSQAVTETIALTIGLNEGTVTLDTGLSHLDEIAPGSSEAVGKALATVGASKGGVSESDIPLDTSTGATRL